MNRYILKFTTQCFIIYLEKDFKLIIIVEDTLKTI